MTESIDSDWLIFADEESGSSSSVDAWKILLVDDDPSVHQATKVALKFFTFENRSLNFISAYSGAEAKELLEGNPDTALILLDVIMEAKDSGLKVAKYVRELQRVFAGLFQLGALSFAQLLPKFILIR